jgi:hypothetical protein
LSQISSAASSISRIALGNKSGRESERSVLYCLLGKPVYLGFSSFLPAL